jgi:hypothetical protein
LAGYESGSPCSAALLPIVVGEGHSFMGDAVDVRRPVAHLAAAVEADVPPAYIVSPQDENVWSIGSIWQAILQKILEISS